MNYLVPVALALLLAGCAPMSQQDVIELQETADRTLWELDQRIDQLRDRIEAGEVSDRNKATEYLGALEKLKADFQEGKDRVDLLITETGEIRPGGLGDLIGSVAPEFGAIITLLGLGIEGWRRSSRWKSATRGLVEALDGAKKDSPELAKAFNENGDSIRSRMPETTRSAVSKLRG